MADKGILVSDQDGGESIACVDIRKNDSDGNPRIAQLMSNVPSPGGVIGVESGTPIRVVDCGVGEVESMGDDVIISFAQAAADGITSSLLDVSDASAFVVYLKWDVEYSGYARYFRGMLTPLVFNDAADELAFPMYPALVSGIQGFPEGYFSGQLFPEDDFGSDNPSVYRISDTEMMSVPMVFPSMGAKNIGFHFRVSSPTTHVVSIYAYPLSGASADAALSHAALITREITTSCVPGVIIAGGGEGGE
jgi:hypothetical protein